MNYISFNFNLILRKKRGKDRLFTWGGLNPDKTNKKWL